MLVERLFLSSNPDFTSVNKLLAFLHGFGMIFLTCRLNVNVADVKNVIIWGNHSSTQFPDVRHATVTSGGQSRPVYSAVGDDAWLQGDFVSVSVLSGAFSLHGIFPITIHFWRRPFKPEALP